MSNLWWLWAIFSSILSGITIYANQIFKMPSSLMMTYRGLGQSLFLLPFCFLFDMPQNPLFWIFGTIQGLMIAYSDKRTFLCSRLYGGEIVATIKPYIISFVFILWLIIKPHQFVELSQNPEHFAVIISALIGIIFSLKFLCNTSIRKDAFILMLPSLVVSSLIDINNKNVTTLGASSGLFSAIFYYCILTAFFAGLPNFIYFCRSKKRQLIFSPKFMIGGVIVICGNIFGNIFKNVAMFYTKNPAYVSAIMSLYPIWIIIWNYFYYKKENVEKFPSCNLFIILLMLISIITLILVQ